MQSLGAQTITCPLYAPLRSGSERSGVSSNGHMNRRSSIDAAKTTEENRKHWNNADNLGPVSAITPQTRQIIRNRSRYEWINNPFYTGVVRTLVKDTIGRGPRLRMLTDDSVLNNSVDSMWREWAMASDWGLNMRVMAGVRYLAGDCAGIFRDSKRLARMGLPVTLDIRLIEPDQMAHPLNDQPDEYSDDGVDCDADGEPIAYRVLKVHPGDQRRSYGSMMKADRYNADDVLHWLIPDRPGQLRGYSPLVSALPIFAQLRRFTSATLTAAEVAAMLAGMLESDLPWDIDSPLADQEKWFDNIELVRGTLLTLPPGVKATQFKPEQPTTGYDMFVNAKLREIGRAADMPFGKVAGDHSSYNFSSMKGDDAPYWADREIERQTFESKVFNPFFYRWCDFARFAIPRLAAFQGKWWQLPHVWEYDARPVYDGVKDATADELNLTNGSDSLDAIASRDGTTVAQLIASRKETKRQFEEAGLPLPPWLAGTPAVARAGDGMPAKVGAAV